jgi:UDP-3-O-[3-hydroxymyristoyl] glucosamine N-acyltransferase
MKRILFIAFALTLAACASSTTTTATGPANQLIVALSRISNTGVADLTVSENVANAATPPDTAGATCAAAAITVAQQVQKVMTAANVSNAGVFTTAELASLFQPGSPQYNQAANTLAAGCIAKANTVLGPTGVIAAGGVVGALANSNALLPLVAAAP